jgi:hypothetical protein
VWWAGLAVVMCAGALADWYHTRSWRLRALGLRDQVVQMIHEKYEDPGGAGDVNPGDPV